AAQVGGGTNGNYGGVSLTNGNVYANSLTLTGAVFNVPGSMTVVSNLSTGTLTLSNMTLGSILMATSDHTVVPVNIGSGLTLSGTNLTATGGGSASPQIVWNIIMDNVTIMTNYYAVAGFLRLGQSGMEASTARAVSYLPPGTYTNLAIWNNYSTFSVGYTNWVEFVTNGTIAMTAQITGDGTANFNIGMNTTGSATIVGTNNTGWFHVYNTSAGMTNETGVYGGVSLMRQ
ncbi:MAG: hypothetical protein KGJ13_07360, partial [Patescibacteria group bacterium]|nr:hypothetical protein [Patescibacteria group bacterium]